MAQYTWKIETLESHPLVNGLENVVAAVHWRLVSTDDVNTVEAYGSVNLEAPDSDNFYQYNILTEEHIVEWAKAALGEGKVQALYESLNNQLSAISNPEKVKTSLPWA